MKMTNSKHEKGESLTTNGKQGVIRAEKGETLLPKDLLLQAQLASGESWDSLQLELMSWPDWKILSVFADALHWVDELRDEDLRYAILQMIGGGLIQGRVTVTDLEGLIYLNLRNSLLRQVIHPSNGIARA
jgi:hypothetical protein